MTGAAGSAGRGPHAGADPRPARPGGHKGPPLLPLSGGIAPAAGSSLGALAVGATTLPLSGGIAPAAGQFSAAAGPRGVPQRRCMRET